MLPLLESSGIDSQELDGISVDFFLLFWRLSLEDIVVPDEQYERSLNKIQSTINEASLYHKP